MRNRVCAILMAVVLVFEHIASGAPLIVQKAAVEL